MTEQWHIELSPISTSAEIRDTTGHKICGEIGHRDHANLIAAAPELLAALKMLNKFFEKSGSSINTRWSRIGPEDRIAIVEAMRAAIAKAEDQSSSTARRTTRR